ncbi:MAG: excisionase family DNA-binding protein [Armatimonadota bacterium]
MNQSEWTISVPEAGRRIGVGRSVAFRLAREGVIPVLRLGKKMRVPVEALNRMLAEAGRKNDLD